MFLLHTDQTNYKLDQIDQTNFINLKIKFMKTP
jgi:hypothetical protein